MVTFFFIHNKGARWYIVIGEVLWQKQIVENSKKCMVESQILFRNIQDPRIINAFTKVDREDFVSPGYKKHTYADIELPIKKEGAFMLRPYILAKIIERVVELSPFNLLIVGDVSGYTTSIFNHVFNDSSCNVISDQNFVNDKFIKFDVIFFDATFYRGAVIEETKQLLSADGKMLYMLRDVTDGCSNNGRNMLIHIKIIETSHHNKFNTILSTNILNC